MNKDSKVIDIDKVVFKFAGDYGDGMKLTGRQFTETSAFLGSDLLTFLFFSTQKDYYYLKERHFLPL